MSDKLLYDNEWLQMKEIDGTYVYCHEVRCGGNIVAILPFQYYPDEYGMQYLLRHEVTPCWGMEPQWSSITGGVEKGMSVLDTAVMELEEEAGYRIPADEMIELGTCRGTKCVDTVYHLFTVDLTGVKRGEAKGDGSEMEALASCHWKGSIIDGVDPLLYVLQYRLNKMMQVVSRI